MSKTKEHNKRCPTFWFFVQRKRLLFSSSLQLIIYTNCDSVLSIPQEKKNIHKNGSQKSFLPFFMREFFQPNRVDFTIHYTTSSQSVEKFLNICMQLRNVSSFLWDSWTERFKPENSMMQSSIDFFFENHFKANLAKCKISSCSRCNECRL